MNERYRRRYDASARSRSRWVQELACSAWAWTIIVLAAMHHISWNALAKTYLVFLFWIAVNQIRTLTAHRYLNETDAPLTYLDQVLDTNTFPRGMILAELWAPLGMRYHALHHLMPSMPYHAMPHAHRRLMAQLPLNSPYHQTVRPGLWPVLVSMVVNRETRPAARLR